MTLILQQEPTADYVRPAGVRPFIAIRPPEGRPADRSRDLVEGPRHEAADSELKAHVERSIKAIENAGSIIGALGGKNRTYEDAIRDLNRTIAKLKTSLDDTSQKAAAAENQLRREIDKAERAEARAETFVTQIRQLELREKIARENLDRVMKVVDAAFGLPARTGDPEGKSAGPG